MMMMMIVVMKVGLIVLAAADDDDEDDEDKHFTIDTEIGHNCQFTVNIVPYSSRGR